MEVSALLQQEVPGLWGVLLLVPGALQPHRLNHPSRNDPRPSPQRYAAALLLLIGLLCHQRVCHRLLLCGCVLEMKGSDPHPAATPHLHLVAAAADCCCCCCLARRPT